LELLFVIQREYFQGLTIWEMIDKLSHVDLLMYIEHYGRRFEEVSRDNLYSAQIACEVSRVLSTKPNEIKVSDFIFSFRKKTGESSDSESKNKMLASTPHRRRAHQRAIGTPAVRKTRKPEDISPVIKEIMKKENEE